MLDLVLDPEQLESWREKHCLVVPGALDPARLSALREWTNEVVAWPETPGKWMKYFESSDRSERQLCRVENFIPFHSGFEQLLVGSQTLEVLTALMGEDAVIYKEKINLKLPGGAGFSAHQDAPVFSEFGHRYHITMMVAIDDSTQSNGCLEMSDPVDVYTLLDQAPDKTVEPRVEAEIPWRPLEVRAGDIVFFDSYIPHRSSANTSDRSRRALYVTYNRLSEGFVRAEYFQAKRHAFPPECERDPSVDYSRLSTPFNVGNPIR
jgi:hypothetical protein